MRLFVAAEPSERVRLAAAETGATLRAALDAKHASRGFRWIPPENLHLTVWFLGEVSDQRSAAILDTLRSPLTERPFSLRISGLGAFPPSGSPRVIWMGVTEGLDALARLQLAAHRHACQVRLRDALPELLELVTFMGLTDVLPD